MNVLSDIWRFLWRCNRLVSVRGVTDALTTLPRVTWSEHAALRVLTVLGFEYISRPLRCIFGWLQSLFPGNHHDANTQLMINSLCNTDPEKGTIPFKRTRSPPIRKPYSPCTFEPNFEPLILYRPSLLLSFRCSFLGLVLILARIFIVPSSFFISLRHLSRLPS